MSRRSQINGLPMTSFPTTMDSGDVSFMKLVVSKSSFIDTISLLSLGISIPTADRPGMGASIRTAAAAKARAISFERATILFTFIPGAGWNSYRVMVGPILTLTTFPGTLNSRKVCSNFLIPRVISSKPYLPVGIFI